MKKVGKYILWFFGFINMMTICLLAQSPKEEAPAIPQAYEEFDAVESVVKEAWDQSDKQADSLLQVKMDAAAYKDTHTISKKEWLSADFKEQYMGSEYQYETPRAQSSWWQDFKQWLIQKLMKLFQVDSELKVGKLLDVIFYILVGVCIALLLYFILKAIYHKDGRWLFKKKAKKLVEAADDFGEILHRTDYADMIAKLKQQGDYRMAVRYYFGWVLREFIDKGILQYEPNKTTNDYVTEIKTPELRKDFEKVAYLFKFTWYGEFLLNANEFDIVENNFLQILKK